MKWFGLDLNAWQYIKENLKKIEIKLISLGELENILGHTHTHSQNIYTILKLRIEHCIITSDR